ncbi:hypothetical protein Mal15_17560 [Stieleria maiorica]|uniref:Uncharacterized protein n=1 Tax=Stieleria maiorica TaxID=2795974 RepID=A0A5B9MAL0_9BACT|nr:hypothetical protein Mal15_17560 [Stieleria maiorica]
MAGRTHGCLAVRDPWGRSAICGFYLLECSSTRTPDWAYAASGVFSPRWTNINRIGLATKIEL